MRRLLLTAVLATLVRVLVGPAPGLAATVEDDPAMTAFQALGEADRRAVQDALTWTGDYTGAVSGGYGPRTREAVSAYAGKHGLAPAALMGGPARKALLSAAQVLRQGVGFVPVRDKKTAFMLSLPTRLLGKETPLPTGTRYSSPDSTIVVDTLSRPAGEAGLSEAFARMTAPQPRRKVTYKLLRDDFFVVSGELDDRKFYSRYVLGTAGEASLVRGFTFSYPQAAAGRLDAVSLAVAASFDAFPGSGASSSPAGSPPVAQASPSPPSQPGIDAQAVMVAPGLALSSITRSSCETPLLDKVALKYRAEDRAAGLALLEVTGRAGLPPSLDPDRTDDAPVVVLFNGRSGATFAAPGQASYPGQDDFTLSAPLQAGSRGAPVFDRMGSLMGLAGPAKTPPAISGTVLQANYRVTGAKAIAKLLDDAGVARAKPGTTALSFGDVVASQKSQLVTLSCTHG